MFIPGPFWRGQSPTGPEQPQGDRVFAPLIVPPRHMQEWKVPHAPPAHFPRGLSLMQPRVPPTVH